MDKKNDPTGSPVVSFISRLLDHLAIVFSAVMIIIIVVDAATGGVTGVFNDRLARVYMLITGALAMAACVLNLRSLSRLRAVRRYNKLRKRRRRLNENGDEI